MKVLACTIEQTFAVPQHRIKYLLAAVQELSYRSI